MRLVLVRHGQTYANRSGALDTGRPGVPLDPDGLRQARSLAARWTREVAPLPGVVAVSPLRRTRQTVAPLSASARVRPLVRRGIREIRSGDVEMDCFLPSIARYNGTLDRWAHGDLGVRMEGAESGWEVLARSLPVLAEVVAATRGRIGEGGVGVVVAHGALLRLLGAVLSPDIGGDLTMAHRPGNASASLLELAADRGGDPLGWDLLGAFDAVTWNDRPVGEWDRVGGAESLLDNAEG